jgi:hypothetical protein
MRSVVLAICALLCAVLCTEGLARADDNDLTLERLIGPPATPGATPMVTPALRSAYAGLVSELGVALAPRPLQPGDSLGWSGFAANLDVSITQINRSADYWQRGARSVSGQFLPLVGATIRKGIWLPFPSFELAVGGHKLIGSGMFTLEIAAKLALHEGFHDWPIPTIALRVGVAHMFGSPQVSMTILDAGVIISKRFAVRRSLTIDPWVGVGAIVTFSSSQVIDTTPNIDAFRQGPGGPDENANVALPDLDPLPRVRLHAGLRLKVSLFHLTAEAAYVLCNSTGRDCQHDGSIEVVDRSGGQTQLNFAAGIVY